MKNLQQWMFGYGQPHTMAVVRILIGGLITANYLMLMPFFTDWFGEHGFVPASYAERWAQDIPRLNLLAGVTNTNVTMAVFGLAIVASAMMTAGMFTRWASVANLILLTTLHHRTPDILHSGDTVMRAFSLYLAVAPAGLVWSWDAKRAGNPEPPEVSLWPQRLMQIQVAILYLTTALIKWQGNKWREGTATWYTAQLQEFDRFPVPPFVDSPFMTAVATYSTIVIEIALATLVFWKPTRNWVLLAGVMLHLGIEWRMNIPLFAFVMMATYASFIEAPEWKNLVRKFKERRGDEPLEAS